jgi:hypothetical protein
MIDSVSAYSKPLYFSFVDPELGDSGARVRDRLNYGSEPCGTRARSSFANGAVKSRIKPLEASLLGTILRRSPYILTGLPMGSWPPGSFGTRALAPFLVSNMDAQASRPDSGSVEELKGAAVPRCQRRAIEPPGIPEQSMKLQTQSFDNVAPLKHAGRSGDFLRRCFLPARPRAQVCSWPGFF